MSHDEAFHAYVTASSPRLLRVAYLLVGDAAAAEDLLQDAFERLYPRWSRVDAPDAYVKRALANGAANRWRRRSRRPEVALQEHHDRAVESLPAAHDDLLAALAQLPERQRAIVVLRFFDDLSVDQVAGLLGITSGTVKSQTARAIPRLRTLLSLNEEICP